MKRIFRQFELAHFVVACSALLSLGTLTTSEAAFAALTVPSGSVAGVVRDSSGTPQIGVAVELLRNGSTPAGRVFTNEKGFYSISAVMPGQYALKAIGASYIPALKQNVRIRANTVVNLTLNSLYDLMQWVPQPQRPRSQGDDDWAWTLRTASSRPLLRWLDDGSPILIWDGSLDTTTRHSTGSRAETKRSAASGRRMRVVASSSEKSFGASPNRLSYAVQQTSPRRKLVMTADASPFPDSAGSMHAMLGFRQEMADSARGSIQSPIQSSVQTLVAAMSDDQAGAGDRQGLEAVSLRSWESLQLLNDLDAEAGSEQVLARLGSGSGDGSSVLAALPFARVTMHHGQSALEYRVATARSADSDAGDIAPDAWLPILSERDGALVLEHGLHQEIGWSTVAGPAEMQLVIYGDSIANPMVEASGKLSAVEDAGQWMLIDRASGLLRATGPNYSTAGMLASVESRLPGHNHAKLSYASGDALVMHANAKPEDIAMILQGVGTRRAQMYSLALSGTAFGTAEGAGTRWRVSYRWQPAATITRVAPYAIEASEPFLNVYLRQPLWVNRQGPGAMEAQLDMRNLLAEGYQPFLTSDGSHLVFAQAQRCVRGGLAFTF